MLASLHRFWRRLKYRHFDRDLREEMAAHRAMAADALRRGGLPNDDAEREAARSLGNATLAREQSRAVWVPLMLEQLWQDIRHAVRGLARQPGFTIASVVMLTAGIGLVAGFYVVFNGLFVRGWNLPEFNRLFVVDASRWAPPASGQIADGFSMAAYRHVVANSRAADHVLLAYDNMRLRTSPGSGGDYTYGVVVSDNFVSAMRVPIRLGSDPVMNAAGTPAVLISDRLWRRTFASDPGVVGTPIWLSGSAAIVAGVLAPGVDALGPRTIDLIALFRDAPALNRRGTAAVVTDQNRCCVYLAGRLREGWTMAQAEEELRLLTARYRQASGLPPLAVHFNDTTARMLLNAPQGQTVVLTLSLAGLACGMMWILACANVGNLYLARSLRRRHEIAMRLALGASRGRVVRQLLVEGAALGVISGAGALTLSVAVPRVLSLFDEGIPTSMFPTDWRVATVAAAFALFTSLLVSLAPALQTTRGSWRSATLAATPPANRLRGALLAAQIAVAVTLVVGAALLARAVTAAVNLDVDYALRTTTAITFEPPVVPPGVVEASDAYRTVFMRHQAAVGAAIAALQSAADLSVALANTSPGRGLNSFSTAINEPGSEVEFRANLIPFSQAAYRVLEIPLVRGRLPVDDPAASEVAVNERLALDLAPSGDPIGKTIDLHFDRRSYTVVGVVRNTHLTDPQRVEPIVHTAAHAPLGSAMLFARTTPDLEPRVQNIVRAAAPEVRVVVAPLSVALTSTINVASTAAAVAGGAGLLAILLAMLGVFTVFAYIVEERRRDVAIRLALGASRGQVRRTMFRAARGAIVAGLCGGLLLSFVSGTLLRTFLFGVSPFDPISYGAVLALMAGAALIATAVPVRRALRIDPAVVLKGD